MAASSAASMGGTMAPSEFASFDEFVTLRQASLWRQAWLLSHDQGLAEDLVQTTLTKCYPKFDRLNRTGSSFEAYTRRVLYTTYLAWNRRRWLGEVPTEQVRDQPVAPSVGVEPVDLSRALAQLPRAQRAVIVLRYVEDLSETDTAAALGISEGTVKSHAHRALASLRTSTHLKEEL